MKITRADLRKMLKPIVREFVEETIEELVTEGYIKNVIQESVLKGEVISHVITEVFKGFNNTNLQVISSTPSQPRKTKTVKTDDYDDALLNKIKDLSQNAELSTTLAKRRHAYDNIFEETQPTQEIRSNKSNKTDINWASVVDSIPPDNDMIGMQAPVRGASLKEISGELNPLKGVQGEGIDLGIIEALSSKSLWNREKLNKFLSLDNSIQQVERRENVVIPKQPRNI